MWVRRALVAAAVAGLLLLAWLIWDHDEVMAAIERAPPLPFFAAMAILPALGAPATPLVLLAGASFGIPVALAGCILALAANLALCYWLARSGLRPKLESMLRRFERIPNFASERK